MSKSDWNLDNWDVKDGQQRRGQEPVAMRDGKDILAWLKSEERKEIWEAKKFVPSIVFCSIMVVLGLIAWFYILSDQGRLTVLANDINDYGYFLQTEDLDVALEQENVSILEVLPDVDVEKVIELSHKGSMPADINTKGKVMLVNSTLYNGDILHVYLLDERRQVGFVLIPETGEIYELGGIGSRAQNPTDR